MKILSVFLSLIISLSFFDCQPTKEKKEVLVAEHSSLYDEDHTSIQFYDDSTYTFNLYQKSSYYEKSEKYFGEYLFEKDTLRFINRGFQYLTCSKAIIYNGFFEFIGGKSPLKLKIKKANIKEGIVTDSLDNNYAFFTYHPNYYDYFSGNVKPYNLKKKNIETMNQLLELCITENTKRLTHNVNSYTKQCVAVTNSNNEIEVIIYCNCKDNNEEFRYQIGLVEDGGACHFSVKLNLTQGKYSQLYVNGSA